MTKVNKSHFILIKRSGFCARLKMISATESAHKLLHSRIWPLWEGTRCKSMVKAGHKVLIYLAGDESDCKKVIAMAVVKNVVDWSSKHKRCYPLMLDGLPTKVLELKEVRYFDSPVDVREKLDTLSFIPQNKKKWGVAMMGGMRSLNKADYDVLSVD